MNTFDILPVVQLFCLNARIDLNSIVSYCALEYCNLALYNNNDRLLCNSLCKTAPFDLCELFEFFSMAERFRI